MTLFHEFFDLMAGRVPERSALRYRDRDFSYAELKDRSLKLAGGLAGLGIGRGDRVIVHLQNRPEVIELALACSRLGAIFVPANPVLKRRQLTYLAQNCSASLIVATEAVLVAAKELRETCPALKMVVVDAATTTDLLAFAQLISHAWLPRPAGVIDKDPAAILYTSGSTGKPKGVVVSHRNLVSGATCVASYLDNRAEDRLLAALPLSFDYGFSQVTTAFAVGACAVLTQFSTAAALVQEIVAERITGFAGVPTMWAHLAATEWPRVESLRYVTNSGGALAPGIMRKLQERLPQARLFCMYGLTEAFRSTYLEPESLAMRPGSIGKAIPNQEILVLRPDGSRCAPGETGELVHRGSLVALGYWNDEERTRLRFRPLPSKYPGLTAEIAVWSGDLVRADADGYLYFIGRNDDLIKTSGHRVSPTEVEEVAVEVTGVVEALALGVPDEILGQRIVLALVTDTTARGDIVDSVRQYCRMQLPTHMVPAQIHLVKSIPRNGNGKADRAAMFEQLERDGASPSASPTVRAS